MAALLPRPTLKSGPIAWDCPLRRRSVSARRLDALGTCLLVFLAPLAADAQTRAATPSEPVAELSGAASPTSAQSTSSAVRVTWQSGKLSILAQRAPLNLVLRRIASQTGAVIKGAEEFRQPVSLEVSDVSLKQGLQSLLSGADYVMEDSSEGSVRVLIFGVTASLGAGTGAPVSGSNERILATQDKSVSPQPKVHDRKAPESVSPSDEQILRKALSDPDPLVREAARGALLEEDPKGELDDAASQSKSAGGQVRLDALRSMVQNNNADDATRLSALTGALKDDDAAVRAFAVRSLGERGGPEVMGPLRDAFQSGDSKTKIFVLEGIGQSPGSRQLLEDAASDPDPEVQAVALGLLDRAEPPAGQDTDPE